MWFLLFEHSFYVYQDIGSKFYCFQSSVNLVLVRGLVCEQVKLLCQQEGIVIMETVPYKSLEILAEACQTDMVTYITLVSEVNSLIILRTCVVTKLQISSWFPS